MTFICEDIQEYRLTTLKSSSNVDKRITCRYFSHLKGLLQALPRCSL